MHSIFIPCILSTLIIGLLIIVVFLYLKLRAAKRIEPNHQVAVVKPFFTVTPREKELLILVCNGLSNKEIAGKLNISVQTVKNYVSILMEKSHTRSRTQLAIVSMQMELPIK